MVELVTDRGTLKEQVEVGVAPVLTLVLDRLSCSGDQIDMQRGQRTHLIHLELDLLEFS